VLGSVLLVEARSALQY